MNGLYDEQSYTNEIAFSIVSRDIADYSSGFMVFRYHTLTDYIPNYDLKNILPQ